MNSNKITLSLLIASLTWGSGPSHGLPSIFAQSDSILELTDSEAPSLPGLKINHSGKPIPQVESKPPSTLPALSDDILTADSADQTESPERDLGLQSKYDVPSAAGELIRQRFANGKIEVERRVVESSKGDLVNHGAYVQFNERGEIIASGEFIMGKRDGDWSQRLSAEDVQRLTRATALPGFRPPFTSKASFIQGVLDGDWTCADSQGNPVFVWTFKDGERNGVSTFFNAKGEVVQSINYIANKAEGPAKVVLKAGGAAEDVRFEKGRMLRRLDSHYPARAQEERRLRSQAWFLVATPYNLTEHDWASNQARYAEYDTKDRIRHGRSTSYYPNGQKESEGQFAYGKRLGAFVWWYPNGQQKTVGEYQKDIEQGDWRWWHENGMREASGTYVDGKMVAEWSVWDVNGKLVKRSSLNELDSSRTKRIADDSSSAVVR